MKDPNADINAIIARSNARVNGLNAQRGYPQQPPMGGGQMYAGGNPNFNERGGQWAREDGWLAKLLKQGSNAGQGAWGMFRDWRNGLVPDAQKQYQMNRQRYIEEQMKRNGG
jgi:hypothetical protein